MEQTKYSVEDLIANESFQAYCMDRSEEASRFWGEYFDRFPDERSTGLEAKRFYYTLSGNLDPQRYALHVAEFRSRLNLAKPSPQLSLSTPKWRMRRPQLAAAIFFCILSSAIWLYFSLQGPKPEIMANYSTGAGQTSRIHLQDGTVVILNSSSVISLEKGFGEQHRSVILSGEAFFDVRHNDNLPFVVRTKDLIITDLGTKFNVRAYSNDLKTEASLVEGIIEVSTSGQPAKKIRLKPNEKIVYQKSTGDTAQLNRSEVLTKATISQVTKNPIDQTLAETDWMKHKLTFNDEDFEHIAKKMERWYGTKIEITDPKIKDYRFVASFEKESLTEVLDFLINSREFKYRKEGDRIIIY